MLSFKLQEKFLYEFRMKKMHYSKQQNNLIQSEKIDKTFLNCTPTSTTSTSTAETLSYEASAKEIKNTIKNHEASEIEAYTGKPTSSTSSTDSGVNISDSETTTTPPSPNASLQTAVKRFNNHFYKNNKNTNPDKNINNKSNHNKNILNDDGVEDSDNDDYNNSTHFDNKLKSEQHRKRQQVPQQFRKVENSSNGIINTRCLSNQNPNAIESESVINKISYQVKSATVNATPNNEIPSLQHNEFSKPAQPSISISTSTSSSLSMSSSNSDEEHLPSKMYNCTRSPAVSIRSIDSSIIDSDSDSDLNGDIEGEHENYVIKKLGTQVSYPPQHPDIPRINKGHTILNQQVIPNGDAIPPPSPLAALAAIGDNIGAAQALGPIPSISAVAQRPQIGSIALSNSSDVTFGDKHFYEGPVTIQQFLIDSGDKWKDNNGKDNPAFVNDNADLPNNAKDIISSSSPSNKLYGYVAKRKKLVIPGVLAVMALLIVAIIFGSEALNNSKRKIVLGNTEESRKNIPINSTIAQDNVGGGYVLRIVPRDGWLAQPPLNPWVALDLPVERVIILPTRTSECETQAACTYTVRITQTFNIESQQQDDIIYNFLIGGDGNVYEGRGWDNRGSALKGFNDDSISFAYIGLFKKQSPSYKQLNVTKLLLEEGVRLNKLSSDYRIVGANKLDPTSIATSADALYKSFENWPHWSDN